MHSEDEVSFIKTVVVDKFPCELVVAGFGDEYSQYLERYKNTAQSPFSLSFLFLYLASWLMIVSAASPSCLALKPSVMTV